MQPDIVDLQEFYQQGRGRWARSIIERQIRKIWADNRGLRVMGMGYAVPYLEALDDAAFRCAMMPRWQGAARWPVDGLNANFMARDDELPLPDRSIDRLIAVHALENCRNPDRFMREIWRVLDDGGRLMMVVANRTGLWSLSDSTPFGAGRPYSMGQLETVLKSNLFAPTIEARALYFPPLKSRFFHRISGPMERLGAAVLPQLSGVTIIEAQKQIYAGTTTMVSRRARGRRLVPVPQAAVSRDVHQRASDKDH